MRLEDNDPFWDQHSGGSGHTAFPEWSPADGALAAELYASTRDKTRLFLDLLIDRPGELVESIWIAEQMIGSASGADMRAGPRVVARSIWNMRQAQMASGRRYPFKWWRASKGMPTRYAMKPTVAALFRQARLTKPTKLDPPTAPAGWAASQAITTSTEASAPTFVHPRPLASQMKSQTGAAPEPDLPAPHMLDPQSTETMLPAG